MGSRGFVFRPSALGFARSLSLVRVTPCRMPGISWVRVQLGGKGRQWKAMEGPDRKPHPALAITNYSNHNKGRLRSGRRRSGPRQTQRKGGPLRFRAGTIADRRGALRTFSAPRMRCPRNRMGDTSRPIDYPAGTGSQSAAGRLIGIGSISLNIYSAWIRFLRFDCMKNPRRGFRQGAGFALFRDELA